MVCRELGYSGADNATTNSYFGRLETPLQVAQQVIIPYVADEMSCDGSEESLSQCDHYTQADCGEGEAAGVMCILEEEENVQRKRKKRSAASAAAVAESVVNSAEKGAGIIGSAIEYFDKKEKEHQQYLKERPDIVDIGSAGVEIKMKNEKGYMDLGGEFENGGMDVKIQDIPAPSKQTTNGGQAFTYPAGLGPMLMNGCFGTDYKEGDPCYSAKRMNTRCNDMMEAASYVGVGFDGTGEYNHAGRKKSLIQRSCEGKGTYQNEDLPDNMNVFGIYDSKCEGKTYESLAARSASQREQAKMGENEDFLKYTGGSSASVGGGANIGLTGVKVSAEAKYQSNSKKETGTSQKSRATGEASAKDSKTVSGVFEFSCRIRRFEIFLDEVKPDQLSEAFLQDYMALPIRYFDFRNRAPQKFTDFLLRWGTHYIKSASFGGKFTLLRESTISGTETKQEWQAKMQESASQLFESRSTSYGVKAEYEVGWTGASGSVSGSSSDNQNSDTSSSASSSSGSQDASSRSETSMTMDDILVEGGHQRVASILADRNRAGFKGEFVEWLDSIAQYPKGYDFKFGEIADLLDINFRSLLAGGFEPCWKIDNREPVVDDDGNVLTMTTYKVTVKDENGNEKEEVRECHFDSMEDFQEKMDKKRLSLKHAVTLFAKNRGRAWGELTLPAGAVDCEKKSFGTDQISYESLLDGSSYEVAFDLLQPIGDRIQKDDSILLRFVATGDKSGKEERSGKISDESFDYGSDEIEERPEDREDRVPLVPVGSKGSWQVNREQSRAAGQIGKIVTADDMKVYVLGARFTYFSVGTGNYLKWTKFDCQYNVRRFKNLKDIECDMDENSNADEDNEDGDIDWVGTPLAIVTSLDPPNEFLPCNMEWSNHQMLMSDQSCVRFTAASRGPIYFGLSAVPDKLSTWYYIRITSVGFCSKMFLFCIFFRMM